MPFFVAKDKKEYETFADECYNRNIIIGREISDMIHKWLVDKGIIKK